MALYSVLTWDVNIWKIYIIASLTPSMNAAMNASMNTAMNVFTVESRVLLQ